MLKFNLVRDTLHQNLWLQAIEELQADGLETTVAPNARFREEYAERATSIRHLSDGTHGQDGGWASGAQPDGQHEFGYLTKPEPLGDEASVPAPDPALYATYDGAMGKPSGPSLGTGTGLAGKITDTISWAAGRPSPRECDGSAVPLATAPGDGQRVHSLFPGDGDLACFFNDQPGRRVLAGWRALADAYAVTGGLSGVDAVASGASRQRR